MGTAKQRAILVSGGILALGLAVVFGLLLRSLAREREARHHNNLGVAFLGFGYGGVPHSKEAIQEFEAALGISPGHDLARLNLGIALFHSRDEGRALQTVLDVLYQNPESHHANYVAGLINLERKEPGAAREHLERVVKGDPEHAHAWYYLGQCLVKEGAMEEGIQALRKAVAKAPYYDDFRMELQKVLLKAGRKDESEVEERVIQAHWPKIEEKTARFLKGLDFTFIHMSYGGAYRFFRRPMTASPS